MTPYYADDWLTIYEGDCRTVLTELPADSVDCVVTSPPYWGLRDYGTDGQLGLERTPEEYVANMVAVFAEVRRVLKPSGTCWLNLGDTFYSSTATQGRNEDKSIGAGLLTTGRTAANSTVAMGATTFRREVAGLKPKDLVGIPWRVAFALQADGWYLRSDIIWSKPNPMPESVTDRPTKSHEMVFLLTKSPRYYFDSDAVREGVGESGVIQAPNGNHKRLVLGQDFGLERSATNPSAVSVRLASAILDRTGGQDQLGLSAFDSQVGEQGSGDGAGSGTVGDPIMRRAATEAARFADGDVSAKEFLREMDRLCVALPDGHDLKELRVGAGLAATAPVPLIDPDGDASVAVNDAGEVGEVDGIHHQEYTSGPTHRSAHMVGTSRNDGDRWRTVDGGVAPRGAGRNIRSVWTIATVPYGSTTIGDAEGGHRDTLSPDCPVHSLRAIRRSRQTDGDDGLLDHLRSRNPRSGSRPEPMPSDGLFASLDLDSPGRDPSIPDSQDRRSSDATTLGSAHESRTPDQPTSGDGQGSDAGTDGRTNHTQGLTSETDQGEPSDSDGDVATRRSGRESRTSEQSAQPDSSEPLSAAGTPDTSASSGSVCSCPNYSASHFAVFPPELPERCIKAGSSEKGVCPECGAPWERVVERTEQWDLSTPARRKAFEHRRQLTAERTGRTDGLTQPAGAFGPDVQRETTGWRPVCNHTVGDWQVLPNPAPAVILDPFAGSGTVGLVANRLSRRAILIDLNPEYLRQQMKRNAQTPLGLGAA